VIGTEKDLQTTFPLLSYAYFRVEVLPTMQHYLVRNGDSYAVGAY